MYDTSSVQYFPAEKNVNRWQIINSFQVRDVLPQNYKLFFLILPLLLIVTTGKYMYVVTLNYLLNEALQYKKNPNPRHSLWCSTVGQRCNLRKLIVDRIYGSYKGCLF